MKKRILAWLILGVILLAAGCSDTPPEVPDAIGSAADTNAPLPPQTDETAPITTAPEPPETVPAKETPYTLKIPRPDIMIYKEPGYDFDPVGKLVDIGTYTIVEESLDAEGIRWGKLKSGIGWIDLDKVDDAVGMIPITLEEISRAEHKALDCHSHVIEDAPHTRYLLFEAYEPLRDIRFCYMDFVEDGFQPGETLYTLSEMKPGKPLVIGVIFHGDFTTFGLSFTCDGGYKASYRIYESGRNGGIEMQEYPIQ